MTRSLPLVQDAITAATALIQWLMYKYLGEYTESHTRTLQRRIAQWRLEQCNQEEKMRALMITAKQTPPTYAIETTGTQTRCKRDKKYGEISQSQT